MKKGMAISPLDGRYYNKLSHLSKYFSEYALVQKRCEVELKYLIALDQTNLFTELSQEKIDLINETKEQFDYDDYKLIKNIESDINHDVKACEYYLQDQLSLPNNNMIHFGLTSEDINNLSYSLLFEEFKTQTYLPLLKKMMQKLIGLAEEWKNIVFPAKTHGQKASPTTAGKEIAVFVSRLLKYYKHLLSFKFKAKLNGATGNFSAMSVAFADYDWMDFSCNFIEKLGLKFNLATTQIEDHDTWADFFNIIRQLNNIILDLNTDIWLYISEKLFKQKIVKSEVGSSTMPHKINPINFENSEGNLQIANALLCFLSNKLTQSRLQRDLSDSTVERNIGVALSHSYLAIKQTLLGLDKLEIDQKECSRQLKNSQELLAEPVQSILRSAGVDKPYELLKNRTRGHEVGPDFINKLVSKLDLDEKYIKQLKNLSVEEYTGLAEMICQNIIDKAKEIL